MKTPVTNIDITLDELQVLYEYHVKKYLDFKLYMTDKKIEKNKDCIKRLKVLKKNVKLRGDNIRFFYFNGHLKWKRD